MLLQCFPRVFCTVLDAMLGLTGSLPVIIGFGSLQELLRSLFHYCGIQPFRRRPGPCFWTGPASSSWAWARYWRAIGDGVGLSYGPEYGSKVMLVERREVLTKVSVKFLEIGSDVGVSDWATVVVRSSPIGSSLDVGADTWSRGLRATTGGGYADEVESAMCVVVWPQRLAGVACISWVGDQLVRLGGQSWSRATKLSKLIPGWNVTGLFRGKAFWYDWLVAPLPPKSCGHGRTVLPIPTLENLVTRQTSTSVYVHSTHKFMEVANAGQTGET